MGVGATCRLSSISNRKKFWRFIAVNVSGYSTKEVDSLRTDLRAAEVPHELIAWEPADDTDREAARDLLTVRTLVRDSARDEMLARERELVAEIGDSVYVDGRYADHAVPSPLRFVVGIIKSQRARYLANRPLEVLYHLQAGERTPAFLIEMARGKSYRRDQVVTFYVRLTSPAVVGPSGGLIRIELSRRYFMTEAQKDWDLLDAIAADLTYLRTRDMMYPRGAVTVEPIRLIERELQLIFRDAQLAAIETTRLLLN